jgi:hypothetical protein
MILPKIKQKNILHELEKSLEGQRERESLFTQLRMHMHVEIYEILIITLAALSNIKIEKEKNHF